MSRETQQQKKLRRKRAKDKRKKKRNEQKQAAYLAKTRFPKFEIVEQGANSEFIDAVKQAVEKVDFNSDAFSNWHREKYSILARDGFEASLRSVWVEQQVLIDSPRSNWLFPSFNLAVGTAIQEQIPEELLSRLIPYNDFSVIPNGNRFRITFSKLEQDNIEGQRLFYSRHRPTVVVDGEEKIVAFTRHVIERVKERINPRWMSYAAAGDVHAYFSHCRHFEYLDLHHNQPAVTFYNRVDDGFRDSTVYGNGEFVGEAFSSRFNTYYRMGYCPVATLGPYAVCKTFLFPGYRNTPEYGAVVASDLSWQEKRRFLEICEGMTADDVISSDRINVIKWFHHNGVPQVIRSTKEFFDYS